MRFEFSNSRVRSPSHQQRKLLDDGFGPISSRVIAYDRLADEAMALAEYVKQKVMNTEFSSKTGCDFLRKWQEDNYDYCLQMAGFSKKFNNPGPLLLWHTTAAEDPASKTN